MFGQVSHTLDAASKRVHSGKSQYGTLVPSLKGLPLLNQKSLGNTENIDIRDMTKSSSF